MNADRKHTIYLAGPMGFSESGRDFLEAKLLPLVEEAGFEPINPWALTSPELIERVRALPYGEDRRIQWQALNETIGANNTGALDRADALVAVLDGADVDSGTAAEIGYACALGIRMIGYRGDFRLAGDNEGGIVNLQVEYFLRRRGGEIALDLVTLKKLLEQLKADLDG